MRKVGSLILLLWMLGGNTGCRKEQYQPYSKERAATEMQKLVEAISAWSRQQKADFIILPQNGPELAFEEANPEGSLRESYLRAISGFTIEELLYNGTYQPDEERLSVIRRLRQYKPVLVSDYVAQDSLWQQAWDALRAEGCIPFVRRSQNYYYEELPPPPPNAHDSAVTDLSQVRNFLYLLNPHRFSSRSEYIEQLAARPEDLLVIDAQFGGEWLTPSEVQRLQRKPDGARRLVIAYINIGAAERFRYYWKPSWQLGNPPWIRRPYPGYPDEYYVAYWYPEWQAILYGSPDSYMGHILQAGFDGAFLDNVEAYHFVAE